MSTVSSTRPSRSAIFPSRSRIGGNFELVVLLLSKATFDAGFHFKIDASCLCTYRAKAFGKSGFLALYCNIWLFFR